MTRRTPPVEKEWSWDKNRSLRIVGSRIHLEVGQEWGESCTLRAFLKGKLTWHLPAEVRHAALRSAQAILGHTRRLPKAVLNGDEDALVPAVRRARLKNEEEARRRDAENARLATEVLPGELPDRQCPVCIALLDKHRLNRVAFERIVTRTFPHGRHARALRAVGRRVQELKDGAKDTPCQACSQPRRPLDKLPSLFSAPGGMSSTEFRRCRACGAVWMETAYFEEHREDPHDVQRAPLAAVRGSLTAMLGLGIVADWLTPLMKR